MTGGAFFPAAHVDDYELDELGQVGTGHAVQWIGTPGVKGPKWGKLPLLTVGMLGIQCVWSIEMGYGELRRFEYPSKFHDTKAVVDVRVESLGVEGTKLDR